MGGIWQDEKPRSGSTLVRAMPPALIALLLPSMLSPMKLVLPRLLAIALSLSCAALPVLRGAENEAEPPPKAPAEPAGPMWNVPALAAAPKTCPAESMRAEGMKAIFFDGLPYQGKPMRVFAWLGQPKLEPGKAVSTRFVCRFEKVKAPSPPRRSRP